MTSIPLSQQLNTLNRTAISSRKSNVADLHVSKNNDNHIESGFNELLTFIETKNIKEIIQNFNHSKVLGKIFFEEFNNQNDYGIDINFVKLPQNSKTYRIITYRENTDVPEKTQFLEMDDDNDTKFDIVANTQSEWINNIFKLKFGKDEYKAKLTEWINEVYRQSFVLDNPLLSSTNNANIAKPYVKDSIYSLLNAILNESEEKDYPTFNLPKLGQLKQNEDRNQWILLSHNTINKNITFNLNENDKLIEFIAHVFSNNPENKTKIIEKLNHIFNVYLEKKISHENNDAQLMEHVHEQEEEMMREINEHRHTQQVEIPSNEQFQERNEEEFHFFNEMVSNDIGEFDEMSFLASLNSINVDDLEPPPSIDDDYYNSSEYLEQIQSEMDSMGNYDSYNNDQYFISESEYDFEQPIPTQDEQWYNDNVKPVKEPEMTINWSELGQWDCPIHHIFLYKSINKLMVAPNYDENTDTFIFKLKIETSPIIKVRAYDDYIEFIDDNNSLIKQCSFHEFYNELFTRLNLTPKQISRTFVDLVANLNSHKQQILEFSQQITKNKLINDFVDALPNISDTLYIEDIIKIIQNDNLLPLEVQEGANGRPSYFIGNEISFRFKDNQWFYIQQNEHGKNTSPVSDNKQEFFSTICAIAQQVLKTDISPNELINTINKNHKDNLFYEIDGMNDWLEFINSETQSLSKTVSVTQIEPEINENQITNSNLTQEFVPTHEDINENENNKMELNSIVETIIDPSYIQNDNIPTDVSNNEQIETVSQNTMSDETSTYFAKNNNDTVSMNLENSTELSSSALIENESQSHNHKDNNVPSDSSLENNHELLNHSPEHGMITDTIVEEVIDLPHVDDIDDDREYNYQDEYSFEEESRHNDNNHYSELNSSSEPEIITTNEIEIESLNDLQNNQVQSHLHSQDNSNPIDKKEPVSVVNTNQSTLVENPKENNPEKLKRQKTASEIVNKQMEQQILQGVTLDNFNKLVAAKKAELLKNREIHQCFKVDTFFKEIVNNDDVFKSYKIIPNDNGNSDEFLVGKTQTLINLQQVKIANNNKMPSVGEFFLKLLEEKHVSLDTINTFLDTLNNHLSPEFDKKVQEICLKEMEERTHELKIQQRVEKANSNVIPKNTLLQKSDSSSNDNLTPEERWNEMFLKDKKNWNTPLRQYLYDYELEPMQNNRVHVEIPTLINKMIGLQNFLNKNKNIPVIPSLVRNKDVLDIQYPNKQNGNMMSMTLVVPYPNDDIHIRIVSGLKSESWEVLNGKSIQIKGRNVSHGDSLIECLTNILPVYGVNLNSNVSIGNFHKKIGECLEQQFMRSYPKLELLSANSSVSNSTSGECGEMKWSAYMEGGGCIRIFNAGDEFIHDGLTIAKLIAMQMDKTKRKGWERFVTKEYSVWRERDDNKELEEEAKTLIKEHYFGLNSLQRQMLLTNIGSENTKSNSKFTTDDFYKLIPIRTDADTETAEKYLIEHRFLNPLLLAPAKNKGWYGGQYDYQYLQKYNPNALNEDSFVPVVVFPNPSGTFMAVRGADKYGIASTVKENVPGSQDANNPIVVESSSLFTYRDNDDPAAKRTSIVFCESAIDAWSYHSLYPDAIVFSMSGAKTNLLLRSLQELYDHITPKAIEENQIQYVYALDNIEIGSDGVELDSTSRANYFRLWDNMGAFCWLKFYQAHSEHLNTTESPIESIIEIFKELGYSQQQIENANEKFGLYLNDGNVADMQLVDFQKTVGKVLFEFDYIDKGLFKLATPTHPELSDIKDWNDYLKQLYLLREKENPNLSRQEIHNLITYEHSPNLILKSELKQELNSKMKLG